MDSVRLMETTLNLELKIKFNNAMAEQTQHAKQLALWLMIAYVTSKFTIISTNKFMFTATTAQ
jgi:hypothetical protein